MSEAVFTKDRHVTFFLRCLKTFLPGLYTSNDSNRMLLAFFIVAGLDLLGALESKTTPEERQGYIEWIYQCQVPSGGFRGFTGTDFGTELRTPENEAWDPANVPSTFFALVILLILGDDLSRVKRMECLKWLRKMQRPNGSFGEVLGPDESVEGGGDLRFCCFAAGTRYILRGKRDTGLDGIEDIDVGKLVAFIVSCQAYDGGMAEGPYCEAHSGHTYCAVNTLTFLNRVSDDSWRVPLVSPGSHQFESLVRWLVSRQTNELGDEDEDEDDEKEEDDVDDSNSPANDVQGLSEAVNELDLNNSIDALPIILPPGEESLQWAGFNGRCNKYADTCYSFWNAATLDMLGRLSMVDAERNRRYLLQKTQHLVGGFGKSVGELPDLLHSYFGMVSLAFQGEQGLDSVDSALCATHRTVRRLHSLPWWQENE
ncbi:terpenoid cyclases/protein prenyltransferase alpha-alpha toroid [Aspergillus tetrazonus]